MYTNQLLDAYKNHMKFVQYKQVAHELGLTPQMMTEIRKGRVHLRENIGLFIAEQIGENKEKVLLGLATDRAKSPEEKAIWEEITKKFKRLEKPIITIAYTSFMTLYLLPKCALSILCKILFSNTFYICTI